MKIIGIDIKVSIHLVRAETIKIRWSKHEQFERGVMPFDDDILRLSNEGKTQAEIGRIVGLNQGSVSRRLRIVKGRHK